MSIYYNKFEFNYINDTIFKDIFTSFDIEVESSNIVKQKITDNTTIEALSSEWYSNSSYWWIIALFNEQKNIIYDNILPREVYTQEVEFNFDKLIRNTLNYIEQNLVIEQTEANKFPLDEKVKIWFDVLSGNNTQYRLNSQSVRKVNIYLFNYITQYNIKYFSNRLDTLLTENVTLTIDNILQLFVDYLFYNLEYNPEQSIFISDYINLFYQYYFEQSHLLNDEKSTLNLLNPEFLQQFLFEFTRA